MQTWHPRAVSAPANKASGPFIDVAPKIVLHTVEGKGSYSYNPSSYYGNPYWPHATIDGVGIHQHLPIDVYGFALANAAGGVETNRAFAIQCEILWVSAEIADLPDAIMGHLADWVGWVLVQTNAPLTFAEFRGAGSAGEDAPQRFGGVEWLAFTGICGHQHVPENDHWDPGAFPVDRLRRAVVGANPQPPKPDPQGDPRVLSFRYIFDGLDWVFDGPSRLFFHTDDTDQITQVLDVIGMPALGQVSSATHRRYSDLAEAAGFTG